MLRQHGFEGGHARHDVDLLRQAGDGDDLGLGLALRGQALDQFLAGETAEIGVVGADIGREEIFLFLLHRRGKQHDRDAGRLGARQRRDDRLIVDVAQHDQVEFLRDARHRSAATARRHRSWRSDW